MHYDLESESSHPREDTMGAAGEQLLARSKPVNEHEEQMSRTRLTKCELEVMEVIWSRGRVTVNDVVTAISRELAYTTVLTTIRILEEKGVIQRGDKVGRAYTYTPTVSRREVRCGMIGELKDSLFGGSVKSLVMSLLETDSISQADIAALREAADKLENPS